VPHPHSLKKKDDVDGSTPLKSHSMPSPKDITSGRIIYMSGVI